ncbi:MAG: hypothetical protein WD294_05610 [Phycisphaeraceae bacterium]
MTQFNSPSYDVQRPSGQCAFTGEPIQPGETYMATLVEEGELFRRVDVSMAVWEQGRRPEELFSYWQTVLPEREEKKKLFVDNEVLMDLLRRLEDAQQPQRVAFRFVLALILMRKKLLRYDGDAPPPPPQSVSVESGAGNADAEEADTETPQTADEQSGQGGGGWLMTPKVDVHKGPMGKWDEEGTMVVVDPHLDEDGIRQVTEQLNEILQGEL